MSPTADEPPIGSKARVLDRVLGTLAAQHQRVIRLRYGLDPADGRCYTAQEIARLLGISRKTVDEAHREGLHHLRTYRTRSQGHQSYRAFSLLGTPQAAHRTAWGEARLKQQREARTARLQAACDQLQVQGLPVTRNALVALTHADRRAVTAFVQARQEGTGQERLARAYAHLWTQGRTPTAPLLCHLAHVGAKEAGAFLREREAETSLHQQERLERAYADLLHQQARIQHHSPTGTSSREAGSGSTVFA